MLELLSKQIQHNKLTENIEEFQIFLIRPIQQEWVSVLGSNIKYSSAKAEKYL